VILYNELLVLPFWGFDRYTKEAIAEREAMQETRRTFLIEQQKKLDTSTESIDIDK
jgi:hypothetical protein